MRHCLLSHFRLQGPELQGQILLPPRQHHQRRSHCLCVRPIIRSPSAAFTHIHSSNVNAATQTKSATKASPTAGSTTCATTVTCPANDGCKYVAANKKNFYTRCSFDFYGGDMANGISKQTTMKACVDKCAMTTGCVAVSYGSSTCYLKSILRPAVYSSNTNGMLNPRGDGHYANLIVGAYIK